MEITHQIAASGFTEWQGLVLPNYCFEFLVKTLADRQHMRIRPDEQIIINDLLTKYVCELGPSGTKPQLIFAEKSFCQAVKVMILKSSRSSARTRLRRNSLSAYSARRPNTSTNFG